MEQELKCQGNHHAFLWKQKFGKTPPDGTQCQCGRYQYFRGQQVAMLIPTSTPVNMPVLASKTAGRMQ